MVKLLLVALDLRGAVFAGGGQRGYGIRDCLFAGGLCDDAGGRNSLSLS